MIQESLVARTKQDLFSENVDELLPEILLQIAQLNKKERQHKGLYTEELEWTNPMWKIKVLEWLFRSYQDIQIPYRLSC